VSQPGNDNPETNRQAEDDLLQEEEEGPGQGRDDGERDGALTDEDEQ